MRFIELLLGERNVIMQYELAAMALALFVPAGFIKDKRKLTIIWGAVFLFFVYIHRALLPFIISGLYFLLIAGILTVLAAGPAPGCMLRTAAGLKKRLSRYMDEGVRAFTAVILLVLLIQLCRINISLDYDSLRYGLRSDVLLTDGGIGGFFRSLGLVNTVYYYPKGFELITLPLSYTSSFGYVLCFNVWVLIADLLIIGAITDEVLGNGRGRGLFAGAGIMAAAAAALMPGITNMAVTAKPDLITLMCQLVFMLCVVRYLNTGEALLTGIGAGALVLSFSFKPTALVFSSVLGLSALIYIAVARIRLKINAAGIRVLAAAAVFTGIITARTLVLTGMPFTSVFTGVFSRLGFGLKYPLWEQNISGGEAAGMLERLQAYFSRLIHFFFCPTGEDMEHVLMAWGGLVFVVLMAAALLMSGRTILRLDELRRLDFIMYEGVGQDQAPGMAGTPHGAGNRGISEGAGAAFCHSVLIAILAFSLLSMWLLYQVDGNYFMLLYAVSAVCGTIALMTQLRYEQSELGVHNRKLLDGGSPAAVIMLTAVMIYFTAFTGWAGANGFTPADFLNRGYYDHSAVYTDEEDIRASYSTKNPLGWDRHTRVVAFAHEPDCYRLKGRVESWVDIDGTGGNPMLTDTKLDIFKQYLSWADIEYIYADITFLNDDTSERRKRARTLFGYLLEDAVFEEIIFEENSSRYMYCRIDPERAAVSWEVPMTAEQTERVKAQLEMLESVITFGDQ